MTIVKYESKTIDKAFVVLYTDEAPADLHITGADIGLYGEIWPGSVMLTPDERYIYGEDGEFKKINWGGGSPTPPTPTDQYTITCGIEHATISPATYNGGQVSITVTPDEGYFINYPWGMRVNRDGSDYYPSQMSYNYHQCTMTFENIDGDLIVYGDVEDASNYTVVNLYLTGDAHSDQGAELYIPTGDDIWYGIYPNTGLWIDDVTATQVISQDTGMEIQNHKLNAYVHLYNWDDQSVADKTIILDVDTIPAGNEYTVTADYYDGVGTSFESPLAEGEDLNGVIQSEGFYFPFGSVTVNDPDATVTYQSGETYNNVDVHLSAIDHDVTIEYTPVAIGDSQGNTYAITSFLTNATSDLPATADQGDWIDCTIMADQGYEFDMSEVSADMCGQDITGQIYDVVLGENGRVVGFKFGVRVLEGISLTAAATEIVTEP